MPDITSGEIRTNIQRYCQKNVGKEITGPDLANITGTTTRNSNFYRLMTEAEAAGLVKRVSEKPPIMYKILKSNKDIVPINNKKHGNKKQTKKVERSIEVIEAEIVPELDLADDQELANQINWFVQTMLFINVLLEQA